MAAVPASLKTSVKGLLAVLAVLTAGALLRGWLIPAYRGDLAPEAHAWRLRLPWMPSAEVTLAFPTPDDRLWVTVRRRVPEATPLVALRELAAGPAPGSGLARALPEGMAIGQVSITGDTAEIHLAETGPVPDGIDGTGGSPQARRMLSALSRTLGESFSVGSIRVLSSDGKFIAGTSTAGEATVLGSRVFYLWQGRPVPVSVDLPDNSERPAAAVRRLLAGPAPSGAQEAPPGVTILDVRVDGDLAKVYLGLAPPLVSELTAGRWLFAPHAMAIVYTLTDLPGIKRVQFEFPNLPPEARRQCRTPLGVPLVRPDPEPKEARP